MILPSRRHILNYKTIIILKERIIFNEATMTDFEIIEELLDAFGKPKDLVLGLLFKHGIFSYGDYLAARENPSNGPLERDKLSTITATIYNYLRSMAAYFQKDEIPKPEIGSVK
ncbi:MAG TPA: hypothetical protein VK508_00005 [Cyclobacteriaceae bacterium]|nr:hypothetical protein [Cyclobacteriaceae bacterium]